MRTRLDKAINGLKKISDRYNKQDLFEFKEDCIIIKPKPEKIIWIWFSIIFLIGTPAGIVIYLLAQKSTDLLTVLLATGLAIYFSITLHSLLKGEQSLTIDLLTKQFIFERKFQILKKQKTPNRIDFSKIHSVRLKQKNFTKNNKLTRLNFADTQGNIVTYIDLGAGYPNDIIAKKVKFFLEVVLWTFNDKKLKNA